MDAPESVTAEGLRLRLDALERVTARPGAPKVQVVTLAQVGEGHYTFTSKGNMTLEEIVYALDQYRAILLGTARPTKTFRLPRDKGTEGTSTPATMPEEVRR